MGGNRINGERLQEKVLHQNSTQNCLNGIDLDGLAIAMKNRKSSPQTLLLKIETLDKNHPDVDAEDFLATAQKWLRCLKEFADDQGQAVMWKIVDLRKSSALIEVQPVTLKTLRPVKGLVTKWERGLRKIEATGRAPEEFTPTSLAALQEFVLSTPKDAVVKTGNLENLDASKVTALTQKRVQDAVQRMPVEPRREYTSRGQIRGRLAVLDSWDPDERAFHLQVPLAERRLKCTYEDPSLVNALGESFEGAVEVSGLLRYRPDQPWPYAAEVTAIRPLNPNPVSLRELVGIAKLPKGIDSVTYVRSLRDAE